MTAIARDAVASDHLVYAWPFPIGPECEVACADDEQVVMCPAWLVGERLGPGRHLWRTPDPTRPVSAFFVLTAPVEVSFDLVTMFVIPMTGMPVRLRATGSLQIRCSDPGLLVAQFVGLPFDRVNEGVLRSVARSVERMLARLLTRRVVMAGTPLAVTDLGMLPGILDELVAYNPTAGAVFGVDLMRMGHLAIAADDGSNPYLSLPQDWSNGQFHGPNGDAQRGYAAAAAVQVAQRHGEVSLVETARGRPASVPGIGHDPQARPVPQSSPEIIPPIIPPIGPPIGSVPGPSGPLPVSHPAPHPGPAPHATPAGHAPVMAGEIRPRAKSPHEEPPPLPPPPYRSHVEMPHSNEDITQPGVHSPAPGALRFAAGSGYRRDDFQPEARGAIAGIGMSPIGQSSSASGEIGPKVPPGARVLVPGPNGLMQSATVRQLLQGYYELEVGHSGETIWVPVNGVVPEH
jgi:hypothetical protein